MRICILSFNYNRPNHTAQVINALKKNKIKDLFVYVDAPKTEKDKRKVKEVRTVTENFEYPNKQLIIRQKNMGCDRSIPTVIDQKVKEYEGVIVLEDDCIPNPYFIEYMQKALIKYQNNEQIFSVNGYSFPIKDKDNIKQDFFLIHRFSSWGWGIWSKKWIEYRKKTTKYYENIIESAKKRKILSTRVGYNIVRTLSIKLKEENPSWDIFPTAYVAANNMFCLTPKKTFINNIGNDGTGIHPKTTNKFAINQNEFDNNTNITFPEDIKYDKQLNNKVKYFMLTNRKYKYLQLIKDLF